MAFIFLESLEDWFYSARPVDSDVRLLLGYRKQQSQ